MIFHLIDSLGRGGAERVMLEGIHALPDMPHRVLTLHPPHTLASELGDGIVHHCLGHTGPATLLRTVRRLRHLIMRDRPAVLHSHLYWSTLISRLACPAQVAHVRTIHNMMSKSILETSALLAGLEFMTRTSKEVSVCVSEAVRRDYADHFGFPGEAVVIRNAPASRYGISQTRQPTAGRGLSLVQIGSLRPVKNQWYLLDVMQQLRDKMVHLDVYGAGPDRERLSERIRKQNLNVRLCGECPCGPDLMRCYDLLVAPSLHEGYGMAVAEAMSAGLPVMVSDIPAFREVAGERALYINPVRPKSMIGKILAILDKKIDLVDYLGRGNRNPEGERRRFAHQLRHLYHRLCEKGQAVQVDCLA
jgi:glycosyltransferase involved in cell wall biosynthesis